MAEKITTFAPGTARQLLRDVRDLTRRPQFGARLAPNRYATNPITTRYGRTTTSPQNPVYPTTGNVVEVELGNYEPSPLSPGSVASKVFTAYDPRQIVTATSYDAPLPFQGEVVKLFWANGKWWFQHPNFRKATADVSIAPGASGNVSIFDGGSDVGTRTAYYTWADDGGATIDAGDEVWITWRDDEQKWFILPPPIPGEGGEARPVCVLPAGSGYNSDSSNRNKIKFRNASSANNRFVYLHWSSYWGDPTGVGLDFLTTGNLVNAKTDPETTAPFRVTQTGLYRFIFSIMFDDETAHPSYEVLTHTTSGASSGTPHTHTVQVHAQHCWATQLKLYLEYKDPGGAWQFAPEVWHESLWSPQTLSSTMDDGGGDSHECRSPLILYDNCGVVNREYRFSVWGRGWKSSVSGPALTTTPANVTAPSSFVWALRGSSATLQVDRLCDYAATATIVP